MESSGISSTVERIEAAWNLLGPLFEASGFGLYVWDRDGYGRFAPLSAHKRFGPELADLPFLRLWPRDQRYLVVEALEKLQKGEIAHLEAENILETGRKERGRWKLMLYPILGPDQQIEGFMSVTGQDPKYHAQNGQGSGALFNSLLNLADISANGIFLTDSTGHISHANKVVARIIDSDADGLVGLSEFEVIDGLSKRAKHPLEFERLWAETNEQLDWQPIVDFDVALDTDPETRLRIRRCNMPKNMKDQFQRVTAIVDVSEKTEIERMKEALLSTITMISHDLRTPLTSLKGIATSLLQNDIEWDAKTSRSLLKDMVSEVDRLSEMVTDLLDATRIETGAMRLFRQECHIEEIIEDTVDRVRNSAPGHTFSVELPSYLPILNVDRVLISRVIENLLHNAAKYSPEGTQITLKCCSLENDVKVSVTDQGIGIPWEEMGRIFEPFYRINNRSWRNPKGIGVGLSLVKRIVEAHGGRISVESALAQGATFTVSLQAEERHYTCSMGSSLHKQREPYGGEEQWLYVS